jgi:hypothetical protein
LPSKLLEGSAHQSQCQSVPSDWFSGKAKEVRPWCPSPPSFAAPPSPKEEWEWNGLLGCLCRSRVSHQRPDKRCGARDAENLFLRRLTLAGECTSVPVAVISAFIASVGVRMAALLSNGKAECALAAQPAKNRLKISGPIPSFVRTRSGNGNIDGGTRIQRADRFHRRHGDGIITNIVSPRQSKPDWRHQR